MVFDLEWSKINNEKLFQRLSNHLFSFECRHSGFIPSSPYIGKDDGWDGYWKGKYETLTGLFSIQAKWTTKNFEKAEPYLKSQILAEVKKAKAQHVNHLIITTNAELRIKQVARLEKLKGRELKTLQVWHREKLTLKLQGHLFLCHYYFGNAQFLAFVPPALYFEAYEEMLLKAALVGRKDELNRVAKTIATNDSTIVVLHAPGGYGKSHFLKTTAAYLDRRGKAQIFFVRAGLRTLEDAFQNELVAGRKYILFLDDADRFPVETRRLISFARANRNVKVVLACRTAGVSLISNELHNQRATRQTAIELKELNLPELKKILFLASGSKLIDKAEQIIHALNGIPYLIVQYGRRIGRSITDEELRKIYAFLGESVVSDAAKALDGILEGADREELLLHLATIVPVRKDSRLVDRFTEILKKRPDLIERCFDKLLAGRVLRLVGHSFRFYPDMSGDIFLANALANDVEKPQRLFDRWFDDFPSQVLSNLASAAAFEKTNAINRMLSRMIHGWIGSAKTDTAWRRVEKLNHLQKVAHLAPSESLSLIHTYLEEIDSLGGENKHPNLDDFGPVVESLSYQPGFQIEILKLVKKFEELKLDGRFDTYKPLGLVRSLVSPLDRPTSVIGDVLSQLLAWVETEAVSPIEAELASEAAKEILSAAHEYTESFQDTVTFGERILKNTPRVNGLRDIAIKIFQALLGNKRHCQLALTIAGDIGSSRRHQIKEQDVPLAGRIALDRQTVLRELSALDLNQPSPIELSEIEDLLLNWWLMDKPGAKDATNILRRLQRTPRYRFVKRYISPEHVIDDIEGLLLEAPAQDRWTWWWDTYGKLRAEPDERRMQALAKELSLEYQTPDQIKAFLTEMDSLISPLNPWASPPILKFWVDEHPEPFFVLTQSDQWYSVPARFQGQISTAIVKYNGDYVQRKCRDILLKLPDIPPNELHDFMTMVTVNRIPLASLKETFLEIARRGNNLNRGYFIYQLYFYFDTTKDGDSYLELICEATHDELSKAYCNHLSFTLHTLKTNFKISNTRLFDVLRSKLRPVIKDLKELDYHALEVVEFVCERNLDDYIDLIGQRIATGRTDTSMDVIPFDGMPCIKTAVTRQESFNKLMDKIAIWKSGKSLGSFEAGYLIKSIGDSKNDDGKRMLEIWTRDKLGRQIEPTFREATSLMKLLEFGFMDESCWMLALETGSRLNLFDVAKKCFDSFLISGLIENPLGQIPEILTDKRDMCRRLMEKTAVEKVKSYLKECVDQIDQDITNHLNEDQELLNPK